MRRGPPAKITAPPAGGTFDYLLRESRITRRWRRMNTTGRVVAVVVIVVVLYACT